MAHYPGHSGKNTNYGGGMPVVPAQPRPAPSYSAPSIWSATQPRNQATATFLAPPSNPYATSDSVNMYLNNLGAAGKRDYVENGISYKWNPNTKMFEAVSNAGAAQPTVDAAAQSTGGGMGGVNTNFSKITNADQSQRQSLRTQYMMGLSPLQERIRQARVGGTQSSDLLRSQLAQTAIGGFGGISGAAEQRVLDTARGQEGQLISQKADLYTDYLSNLLGVDKQTADAIAKEAVKRASKLAGAEKAYLQSEAEKLMAAYAGIGGK